MTYKLLFLAKGESGVPRAKPLHEAVIHLWA
jgi:hypothetical protein